MDKVDFAQSFESFKQDLGERKFDVEEATEALSNLACKWASIGKDVLDGRISVTTAPEERKIEGAVLGKRFCITYAPYGLKGEGVMEATLSIQHLVTGEAIELSRFLVSLNGSIYSTKGELLIDMDLRDSPRQALMAVASRVLSSPSNA